MDLKISQARLPDRTGLWDIGIQNGIISKIVPVLTVSATHTIEAAGQLVIPGLVDSHFHLDKTLLLDRCTAIAGTFQEAMVQTLQAKQQFTVSDIQTRARKFLERAIAFGTTAIRSHVEVDPVVQLLGMEALLPLQQEYADCLTLQLAVFAQEGITNQPGIEKLLRQAMQMGGNVIGSAPYVDPNPEKNIQSIFEIAQEFNCDVDFHLDFLDDDAPLLLPIVVRETIKRGWQNRVYLGHMTKLAALSPAELAEVAVALKTAGISVFALPASDLYMMSRKDTHNVRRGVAPIHQLATMGVNTGIAVNNVQNLFTPFGDGDLLKICTLIAQTLHLGTVSDHLQILNMVTLNAAKAIGLDSHSLATGSVADLVVLNATSVTEVIGSAPSDRIVIKKGRIVAQSQLQRKLAF